MSGSGAIASRLFLLGRNWRISCGGDGGAGRLGFRRCRVRTPWEMV